MVSIDVKGSSKLIHKQNKYVELKYIKLNENIVF